MPKAVPSLYLSRTLPDPVMEKIRERFRLTAVPGPDPPSRCALLEGVRGADALICMLTERIDEEVIEGAPHVRVIANYAVGYDNIAVTFAKDRGIVVTNTPDVLTEATADLTWALLLGTARRVTEGHALAQSGEWAGWTSTQLLGAEVHGKILGIIGMGRIGQAVARRAMGFSMRVLYWARSPLPPALREDRWKFVSFIELLEQSDFISLHVPLAPETIHLIGEKELQRVRPSSILINTSRGPILDEAALVETIRSGRMAGAGLDVYEREPELHPGLQGLPQVLTLPHLGSATQATRIRMGMMCIDNVLAVIEGRSAPNAVG